MRTLLLTSAGTDIKEEILKILPKDPSQMRLAHIITASKSEPDQSYVKKDTDNLKKMGFEVVNIDIEDRTKTELINILDGFDVIFVQGGNTFHLLKAVRESGFDEVVKKLISKGVIYIGVSAGSIICGPTIETTGWKGTWPDKNKVKLKNLSGLNLIPFNIFVHYESKWAEAFKLEAKRAKYKTRILTDHQAFLMKNGQIALVGDQPEIVL